MGTADLFNSFACKAMQAAKEAEPRERVVAKTGVGLAAAAAQRSRDEAAPPPASQSTSGAARGQWWRERSSQCGSPRSGILSPAIPSQLAPRIRFTAGRRRLRVAEAGAARPVAEAGEISSPSFCARRDRRREQQRSASRTGSRRRDRRGTGERNRGLPARALCAGPAALYAARHVKGSG